MREYTFLFKENETDDRDCVKYVELDSIKKKHLCVDNHFNVHGACFSMSLRGDVAYEDITTILTREEYEALCNPIGADLSSIIAKLESEENEALFEKIKLEEREWLMDEYGLDDDDIDKIFDNYSLDYRDRGVVGCVFKDTYDLGYEEAWSLGYVNNNDTIASRYFNFEEFGEDLAEDEYHVLLDDGRVVSLNY